MRALRVCRRIPVAILAGVLLPLFAAAAPAPPDKDAAAGAAPSPHDGLDRVVTIQLDKQTLSAAVAQIREKTNLNIVLDVPAITGQLGSAPDGTPLARSADLKDVNVRAALRTLLDPYDLTFVVLGDSILVTTEDAATARQMGQRVGVHLDKVEFAAALKQLSRDTGVNLPLDPRAEKEASAKVSLDLEDVPLETAVRLLAEIAGLKPVRVGNTLFVTRKEVAAAMRADPDLNPPPRPVRRFLNEQDISFSTAIWQVQGRTPGQPVRCQRPQPRSAVPVPADRAASARQPRHAAGPGEEGRRQVISSLAASGAASARRVRCNTAG